MNKRIKSSVSLLLIAVAIATLPSEAGLFKKKKKSAVKVEISPTAKDSTEFAKKISELKDLKTGMFDCYRDKEGKLFWVIPDSAMNHTYLLSSRVSGISKTGDLVAGQMNVTPLVIQFSKEGSKLFMHLIQDVAVADDNDPIKASMNRNMINPVVKGFKIEKSAGGKNLVDMTAFFLSDDKLISPIKDSDPLAKLLSGREGIEGTYYADGSTIKNVKSFPDNVMVESQLAYTTRKVTQPYTVNVSRSVMRLPDEPMKSRLQDNRVGYFYDRKQLYSSTSDRIEEYNIINRFRLEPKDEDMDDYFAGKLVEPKKKITFYVDSAFPVKWRNAVKEGIEYWNVAFEAAGFKNAIEAKDYPENDAEFDPDDVRFNCVRYCLTPTANAMGPSHADPRTGEILGADVIWYHNVLSLVHNWRFAQTAAVDPRVRTTVFPDDVMHESLTYVAAHEIGHCLGLMHNMGASYSYDIENLRNPEFTQKYGTTPSIMDYARNNYIAQPGDLERGVKLTPPPVGVYDIHAINWGYRLIPGNTTLFEEKKTLDKWIEEKEGDPMYEFGAQQVLGTCDPTDQTEDLGNDHIKAGDYAISNLKIIMSHLPEWTLEQGRNYESQQTVYNSVVSQYLRHVGHVYPYIGGVVFKEIRQGKEHGPARTYISKHDTKRAMEWLLNQSSTNDWLMPASVLSNYEDIKEWKSKMDRSVIGCILSPVNLNRIKQGGKADSELNYTLNEYLDDAFSAIFDATCKGKSMNDVERNLQSTAVETIIKGSGLPVAGVANAKGAVEIFEEELQSLSVPAVPCMHDVCAHSDQDHSFFRIVMGDTALPAAEYQPMMMARLKKIAKLYRSAKAPDQATKDFYDYQIKKINLVLNTN